MAALSARSIDGHLARHSPKTSCAALVTSKGDHAEWIEKVRKNARRPADLVGSPDTFAGVPRPHANG